MTRARKVASRLAGCLLACCTAAAAAVAQPNDDTTPAFAAGSAAFAAGDYASALDAFERAREQGSDGPAVHYNIGVCEYRLGRYAAAATTFRLVARRFPDMRALAEYNLGLAMTRQGRPDAARAAFARARSGDDETVARLAAAMLGRLDGDAVSGERRALVALVDIAAGHDDNVALVDELSLPADRSADSAFVEAVGYVDAPLDGAGRFGFQATGYVVDYGDAAPYDQVAVRMALGYDPQRAERVTLGPYYERTQLGGRGFEERLGFEVDVSTAVGDRGAMSLRIGVAGVDALDSRYAFVSGDQQRVRARYRQALAGGAFSATYDFENNDRDAASVSPTRKRLSLDWRRRLGANWEAALGLRHRRSEYDELAAPRKEDLGEIWLDLARDLGRSWQVKGGLHVSDNDATDPLYSYEREVLSLGLRKVF